MAIVTGILLAYFINWVFAGAGPVELAVHVRHGGHPVGRLLPAPPPGPGKPALAGQDRAARTRPAASSPGSTRPRPPPGESATSRRRWPSRKGSFGELFQPGFRRPLFVAIVLAVFQQITGINAILYYAPRIFESAGFARMSAIGQSTIIGLANMLFTVVAIVLADRVGRRPLLLVATGGMGVSLVLLGAAFKIQFLPPSALLFIILLYIAFFASAMGPLVWVVMAEIFPIRMRGAAMGLATLILWFADFVVT